MRGFILIELMVVLAILGILFAIMIPAYQEYIEKQQPVVIEQQQQVDESEIGCIICN